MTKDCTNPVEECAIPAMLEAVPKNDSRLDIPYEEPAAPESSIASRCLAAPRSCSDEELVHAAQNGALPALEELLSRHRPMVYRAARRLTGTAEDAEDLVQETMLRAFKNIGRFRNEARFSSWLVAIVVNAALSVKRKEKHFHWVFLDEPVRSNERIPAANLADGGENPEQQCLHMERGILLRRAVSRQHPKFQLILRTCCFDEISINEAARALGITRSTAKSRLYRARRILLRSFQKRAGTGVRK